MTSEQFYDVLNAGLQTWQYGTNGCFCGYYGYNKYGTASNCDIPCIGNNAETCGGFRAHQVHSLSEKKWV